MVNQERRPYRSAWAAVFATAVLCGIVGCDKRSPQLSQSNGKLRAIATISIIGDWVSIVGGDNINLTTLVGPDGDPHEYEPVPSDNLALAQCDLLFENGLGLETWLDKLYASSQSRATRVVVTTGIQPLGPDLDHAPSSDVDPHAWQDVSNAITMVGNIRDALMKADPAHAAQYQTRAADYIGQLSELDQWVQAQINTLSPVRRVIVTSHDAFGYFGKRYGMDVSRDALESVTSEASDPSAMQIAAVVNSIKATGVPAIFLENIQNPKLIEEIAAEAKVTVAPPLYTDALGVSGSAGDTYLKMIRYNVTTIVKALSD